MGRFATCDAASMHVSQSPYPQPHDARASAGRADTSSFTRAMLPCDTVTISLTASGSWAGNEPAGAVDGADWDGAWNTNGMAGARPRNPRLEIESNMEASLEADVIGEWMRSQASSAPAPCGPATR